MPSSVFDGGIRISGHHHVGARFVNAIPKTKIEVVANRDEFDVLFVVEDAADPLTGEVAVLSEHNADRQKAPSISIECKPGATPGTVPHTRVPRPGSEVISSRPPTAPTRSRMLVKPTPSAGERVLDSHTVVRDREVDLFGSAPQGHRDPNTRACVLDHVLDRFREQKSIAPSIGAGQRPSPLSLTLIGIGAVIATERRASATPRSRKTLG